MNRRPPVLALVGAALFSVLFSLVLLEIALHVVGYPRTKTSHQRFYVEHEPQRGWRNVPNADERDYIDRTIHPREPILSLDSPIPPSHLPGGVKYRVADESTSEDEEE